MNGMNFDQLKPIVFATLLSLAAPSAYAGDTRAEIEAVAAEMQAIANRGDSKAIAALYTADAQVLPEGSNPIKGTAAIAKYFQDGFDLDGFGNVRFKTLRGLPRQKSVSMTGATKTACRLTTGSTSSSI